MISVDGVRTDKKSISKTKIIFVGIFIILWITIAIYISITAIAPIDPKYPYHLNTNNGWIAGLAMASITFTMVPMFYILELREGLMGIKN